MSEKKISINVRQPEPRDVDNLHQLILKSTVGKTKITSFSLRNDLFNLEKNYKPEVKSTDPCVNLSTTLTKSNRPLVQALLAEVDDILVGYLLFNYYYSPWCGHAIRIVDLFVAEDYRRKGIAKKLYESVSVQGRDENSYCIMFNAGYTNQELRDTLIKYGCKWYRNDSTDWSVLRIDFK